MELLGEYPANVGCIRHSRFSASSVVLKLKKRKCLTRILQKKLLSKGQIGTENNSNTNTLEGVKWKCLL